MANQKAAKMLIFDNFWWFDGSVIKMAGRSFFSPIGYFRQLLVANGRKCRS